MEVVAATDVIAWTDIATAVGALTATAVVLLGLIFAVYQLRSADKARDIEALTSRSQRWEDAPLVEARRAVSNIGEATELRNHLMELEPGKSDEWYILMRIPHFFEDMGIACLQTKALNIQSVFELFAPPIEFYWGCYEIFIKEYSENVEKDERICEWFEKLALEIKKTKEKKRKNMRRRLAPPDSEESQTGTA